MESKILIFTGPSGVGKSTIINTLKEMFAGKFVFSVSHTTRKRRENEVEGKHYYYVSEDIFTKMLEEGEFIEYTRCHHNYYGTTHKALKDCFSSNRTLLLDLDLEGVKALKDSEDFHDRVFVILLLPTDKNVLADRIKRRNSESSLSFTTRSQSNEIQMLEYGFDENKKYFDIELINDDLDKTVDEVVEFLKKKEIV